MPVRVDVPAGELAGLLLGVKQAMGEFLGVIYQWAEAPDVAALGIDLVAAIDRAFAVAAPLKLPPAPVG